MGNWIKTTNGKLVNLDLIRSVHVSERYGGGYAVIGKPDDQDGLGIEIFNHSSKVICNDFMIVLAQHVGAVSASDLMKDD